MTPRWRSGGAVLFAAMAVGLAVSGRPSAQGLIEEPRTVYITATDATGPVTTLAPADLTLKESGRERRVLSVDGPTERLHVALVVDELLAPDRIVRQAVVQFVQRLRGTADVALFLVGQWFEMRVPYTTELSPFVSAVNAFPGRATAPANLVGSVIEIAREQRKLEGRRAIVIIAPEIPEVSTRRAEGVFDQLRDGGAVLHAATLTARSSGGSMPQMPATRLEGGDLTQLVDRDRVLGDGPKRSGGLRVSSLDVDGIDPALDRIADALLHQLRVTYLVPQGTRSDGRMSVESKRRGVTVRAPSHMAPR